MLDSCIQEKLRKNDERRGKGREKGKKQRGEWGAGEWKGKEKGRRDL